MAGNWDDRNMIREIGGYLELENFIHNERYPTLLALNTARNALAYLCKAKDIQKIYLPYFLCESVSGVCKREDVAFACYHIHADFTPDFTGELTDGEYLYIVNYYGQMTAERVKDYKARYGNIILDNVQAFFDEPLEGIDTIYSCRKFFGVPDGAYLATDAPRLQLETDVSMERIRHLLGRYEGKTASAYYDNFKTNDCSFVNLPVREMSHLTHNLLGAIDYQQITERRNQNWGILHEALGAKNKLKLRQPLGPYMYPFYCDNGLEIKKKLVEQKIFVPTLWPNVLELEDCELEKDYAKNILPLPIDQRYGADEMNRVIEEVLK